MTNGRLRIQVIASIVVAVFAIGILASGGTVQVQWLRFYSAAVTAAFLGLAVWDHWLWRLPVVQRVTKVPRNIRGTWKGRIDSFWKDGAGAALPSKTVYLVVHQSASSVSVLLLTDESRSTSTIATVLSEGITPCLDYMYLSTPDSHLEAQSRMHRGAASLDIIGRPATRIRGRYWTNRDSRGELDLTERVQELVEDFATAERAFSKPEEPSA